VTGQIGGHDRRPAAQCLEDREGRIASLPHAGRDQRVGCGVELAHVRARFDGDQRAIQTESAGLAERLLAAADGEPDRVESPLPRPRQGPREQRPALGAPVPGEVHEHRLAPGDSELGPGPLAVLLVHGRKRGRVDSVWDDQHASAPGAASPDLARRRGTDADDSVDAPREPGVLDDLSRQPRRRTPG
jgi:hypothetical protein